MSEKYKFQDSKALYFTTSTVIHWIDLFTRAELKHVIVESLKFCQREKGLKVHAWVLMPSHIHMIVSSENILLSNIFRDFKKYTARELVKEVGRINESRKDWLLRAFEKSALSQRKVTKYKVWQEGNHPVLLDTNKLVEQKLDYIHQNPVEAEIVDEPEWYWYSSARDYALKPGLLEVELL